MIAPANANGGTAASSPLPFGKFDLDPLVYPVAGDPTRVRCYVRSCRHLLRVAKRDKPGEVCPDHGIRLHHSSSGSTYTYATAKRNIIASPDLFARRVIRHPFKYESHRLGSERSEDALSWNIFRSLQEAGQLHALASQITGQLCHPEPQLYLWGLSLSDNQFDPWQLLIQARQRFESNLPVERPLTEPDIALHLPGHYLILIEAKFTSGNTAYETGARRKNGSSLTLDELRQTYQAPGLRILDIEKARQSKRLYHQLWRNTIFAEWMARTEHPSTKAFHVNLVREGCDAESAAEFSKLLMSGYENRFQQITWEGIYRLYADEPGLKTMRQYMATKTAGLRPAFEL